MQFRIQSLFVVVVVVGFVLGSVNRNFIVNVGVSSNGCGVRGIHDGSFIGNIADVNVGTVWLSYGLCGW